MYCGTEIGKTIPKCVNSADVLLKNDEKSDLLLQQHLVLCAQIFTLNIAYLVALCASLARVVDFTA